jgi:glucose-fructose oxidoreductase
MARKKIRYAIAGLGHIAQVAVLPAFAHSSNSELAAFVSGDRRKLTELGKRYGVDALYTYDEYDRLLSSGEIDAVYIALPNDQHAEFTIRAARAGIHILCEKPMAVTEKECLSMIRAAERNGVKLMIAYRLHFEEANLTAIELVRRGKIGNARIFDSVFTMDVRQGDIRLRKATGGGTLYDIGIYCINAARYLFRDEPVEVVAVSANNGQKRFQEVEEMVSAMLRFPGDRLASFTCSFGASDAARFEVIGTKGRVQLDPAYEYAMALKMKVTVDEKSTEKTFPKRDQFAPELIYFSDCILKNREPEPDGWEGLADVRIIEALYKSARSGRPVRIKAVDKKTRPTLRQHIHRPPVKKPKEFKAQPPSR